MFQGDGYIDEAFDKKQVKQIVTSFGQCLKDEVFGEFNGLACRGSSGLLIAPILAHTFDLHLMLVRKPKDNSHAYYTLNYNDEVKKYIIIDDFACSGKTIEGIVEDVEQESTKRMIQSPIFIGCYFWQNANIGNNKEKIACSDNKRFEKYAKNKIYVARKNDSYLLDTFKGY